MYYETSEERSTMNLKEPVLTSRKVVYRSSRSGCRTILPLLLLLSIYCLIIEDVNSFYIEISGVSRCPQWSFCPTVRSRYNNKYLLRYLKRDLNLMLYAYSNSYDDEEEDEDLFDPSIIEEPFQSVSFDPIVSEDADISIDLSQKEKINFESLTVPELKRQLRLRGLKVSGRKSDLVNRLNSATSSKHVKSSSEASVSNEIINADIIGKSDNKSISKDNKPKSKEQIYVEETLGKELIDVTEYMEENNGESQDTKPSEEEEEETVEVWGSDAVIVNDLDGVSPVVDNISRSVIEYKSANGDKVKAFVAASREALKGFLKGGGASKVEPTELLKKEVSDINKKRKVERIEWQGEVFTVLAEGEKLTDVSIIGASISSQQVHGIIFLSDVRGHNHVDTRAICNKIAFESQPCIVLCPDLFHDEPWDEDDDNPGYDKSGNDYETWRSKHPEGRVHLDIRTAATVLRDRYGASSINIFGTCFGGGRALEVAAGYSPSDMKDFIGARQPEELPPLLDPASCIAWYPTRYNADFLFGSQSKHESTVAIMAIFAEQDEIDGAKPSDAKKLKKLLDDTSWVNDNMVKIFEGENHGFAHVGVADKEGDDFGNGEVAALLSTAWLDTYARVYLPTVGPKVKTEEKWNI